jgi:RNA polymerase sigma-70 factor (ECF subfamily)
MAAPDLAYVRTGDSCAAPLDDAALVARVRVGDESACEALYLEHHARLWRFAYGFVRSRDVAEEIVQEVFLSLWRGRREWDVRTNARAWLYAAVRNQALNHVRHERVVARLATPRADGVDGADAVAGGLVAMGGPPADAHASVEQHELDDAVARAIARLPERRRIAMTLRWKHDLSAAEIARVLATTPESVRVLLCRARQDLAGLLARLRG